MPKSRHPANKRPMRTRHRFFLNPYTDLAFSKCPKCETKTRQRKTPLVVHVEPAEMIVLNKTCRYCEHCDLLIARQTEIESLLALACETHQRDVIGNPYQVIGTLDRCDWRMGSSQETPPADMLDRIYFMKDIWDFEVDYGGWRKDVPDLPAEINPTNQTSDASKFPYHDIKPSQPK